MKHLKWLLILGIAAGAIWLINRRSDEKTPAKTNEKDAINIGRKVRDKMRKNQNLIHLR